MALVKIPVPVPSVVLLFAVVGVGVVPQQTPRTVIVPPPSAVTFPPEEAAVKVTEVIAVVDSVGRLALVVKVISFP